MLYRNYKYLKFITFKDISQWYVEYYLNDDEIHSKYSLVPLRKLIYPRKNVIKKDDYDGVLPIVEKIIFKTGEVVFRKEKATGMNLYLLEQNDLLISNINFHQGASALNTFGNIVASTHYQPYIINMDIVRPNFLIMVLRSPFFLSMVSKKKAQGIKNESGYNFIGSFNLPLPHITEQEEIISVYNDKIQQAEKIADKSLKIEDDIINYFVSILGVNLSQNKKEKNNNYKYLRFVNFLNVSEWGIDIIKKKENNNTSLKN